jgi:hypothetical protein
MKVTRHRNRTVACSLGVRFRSRCPGPCRTSSGFRAHLHETFTEERTALTVSDCPVNQGAEEGGKRLGKIPRGRLTLIFWGFVLSGGSGQ